MFCRFDHYPVYLVVLSWLIPSWFASVFHCLSTQTGCLSFVILKLNVFYCDVCSYFLLKAQQSQVSTIFTDTKAWQCSWSYLHVYKTLGLDSVVECFTKSLKQYWWDFTGKVSNGICFLAVDQALVFRANFYIWH